MRVHCDAVQQLCDACGVYLAPIARSHSFLNEMAATKGWLRLGGRDYCPRCQIGPYLKPPLEAPDADPSLAGHYRCEGRSFDPGDMVTLPPVAAVEGGARAAADTDLFTAGQAVVPSQPGFDAAVRGEGRAFWGRFVRVGRVVFHRWIS